MAAADAQTAARVERMGMAMIQPAAGLAALEGLLRGSPGMATMPAVSAAIPFRWQKYLQRMAPTRPPHFFEEFADEVSLRHDLMQAGVSGGASRSKTQKGPAASVASVAAQVEEVVRSVLGKEVS
jgi:hypothetical protein